MVRIFYIKVISQEFSLEEARMVAKGKAKNYEYGT